MMSMPVPSAVKPQTLPPAIIVIFGITGDLSRRYLLPSLYQLFKRGVFHEATTIIGVSRRELDILTLLQSVEVCVNETDQVCDPAAMAKLRAALRSQQVTMDSLESFQNLRQTLNDIEAERGMCLDRLYYLSVPPAGYGTIISNMGQAGLNGSCPHNTASSRLLVEKPFGQDLRSARQLIETTAKVFQEDQLYRIDHYLAKEAVQNLATFRRHNPLFTPAWNGRHISTIDIVASEALTVEGRGELYEEQGALRDVLQNHLLQILALVIMEQPADDDQQAWHQAKQAALQAVRPVTPEQAWRGQYQGYVNHAGRADSHVETYACVETTIDTPRWQDTRIRLRTGKAMARRYAAITLDFRGPQGNGNRLRFEIQPGQDISLELLAKQPGFSNQLRPVALTFNGKEYSPSDTPTAYERVLADALRGDRRLFASADEILAAWQVIDTVVQSWQKSGAGLQIYAVGSDINSLDKASSQDSR